MDGPDSGGGGEPDPDPERCPITTIGALHELGYNVAVEVDADEYRSRYQFRTQNLRIRVPSVTLGWTFELLTADAQRLLLMEGRAAGEARLYGYLAEAAPECLGEVAAEDWTPTELWGSASLSILDAKGDAALVRAPDGLRVLRWGAGGLEVLGVLPDTGRRDAAAVLDSDAAGVSVAVVEAEGSVGEWLCVEAGCSRGPVLVPVADQPYGVLRPSTSESILLVKQEPADPELVVHRWAAAGPNASLSESCREPLAYEDGTSPARGASLCDLDGDGVHGEVVAVYRRSEGLDSVVAIPVPKAGVAPGRCGRDDVYPWFLTDSAYRLEAQCGDYSRDSVSDVLDSSVKSNFVGAVVTRQDVGTAAVAFNWTDPDLRSPDVATQASLRPFLDGQNLDVILGIPDPFVDDAGFVTVYPWDQPD